MNKQLHLKNKNMKVSGDVGEMQCSNLQTEEQSPQQGSRWYVHLYP